ncbi:putative MFS sugar transporter protein [Sclerotinia borealis F-4128]|uniref:Putative MFS sugar transporter protein n=1 Tax=Sclerotinia borealis (strain F-4128) TaxID=1432307 RepID=W9CGG0_SCLBF|nr:putative MFS sugar transporter protein [Sclerotinia borealis F-4128]
MTSRFDNKLESVDFKNAEENVEEVTIARCGVARYGIDWAIISRINAFKPWHAYFGFGTSGVTYGTLNALMTIGTVCGAPFLAFSDVIGRRDINFAGKLIVLFASLLDEKEKAKRVIAKMKTTEANNVDHPLVTIIADQIEESLQNERQNNRSYWDYRWNGDGIIGQYLVPALDTVRTTGTTEQLGMNFGLNATYLVFTVCGSLIIYKFRRRTLIFAGLISFILLQTAATITSWRYQVTESKVDAGLVVTWLFLFQTCSSLLIATMHNLYPVEILSLDMRAKGVGLYAFVQGAAGTVQNYGISIGIQKIEYKIWVVYVGYNLIQLVLSYFVFPETSALSLEEIDNVFEPPGVRPVKMSLDIQKAI